MEKELLNGKLMAKSMEKNQDHLRKYRKLKR